MMAGRWLLAILCLNAPLLSANERQAVPLSAEPSRCVALRQGQQCYQAVKFEWRLGTQGDYCLYEQGVTTPLSCWTNVDRGRFTLDFQSSQTRQFILRPLGSGESLATAEVRVEWVYDASKRSKIRWRLF